MNKAKILAVISSVAIATASVGADEFIKASSFGWNAEDATSALQSAIDSGAKKVMIDRPEFATSLIASDEVRINNLQ